MKVLVNYYQSKGKLVCKYYEPVFVNQPFAVADYEKDYGDDFVIPVINNIPSILTNEEYKKYLANEKERVKKLATDKAIYTELALNEDNLHVHLCKEKEPCSWFGLLSEEDIKNVKHLIITNGALSKEVTNSTK
jgi:hypothetical protein